MKMVLNMSVFLGLDCLTSEIKKMTQPSVRVSLLGRMFDKDSGLPASLPPNIAKPANPVKQTRCQKQK